MARRKTQRTKATATGGDLDRQIVDRIVALAAEVGWDRVRLRRVAADLDIPLAELQARYRDLDAVADAWFARALAAMVAPREVEFSDLPARERVYLAMMSWFEAQRDLRAVVGQMLRAKLYPSHPHHWVPMVFSLSRLIQWLREAAHLDAPGGRRQVEEVGLTLLFLATLGVWLKDESPDLATTRRFLHRRLADADQLLAALPRPRRRAV
jgi:AcrR family transcriptional regulator